MLTVPWHHILYLPPHPHPCCWHVNCDASIAISVSLLCFAHSSDSDIVGIIHSLYVPLWIAWGLLMLCSHLQQHYQRDEDNRTNTLDVIIENIISSPITVCMHRHSSVIIIIRGSKRSFLYAMVIFLPASTEDIIIIRHSVLNSCHWSFNIAASIRSLPSYAVWLSTSSTITVPEWYPTSVQQSWQHSSLTLSSSGLISDICIYRWIWCNDLRQYDIMTPVGFFHKYQLALFLLRHRYNIKKVNNSCLISSNLVKLTVGDVCMSVHIQYEMMVVSVPHTSIPVPSRHL